MFIITVKTLTGQVLSYRVQKYEIENNQVIFIDSRTNLTKRFSIERTDIEEVR